MHCLSFSKQIGHILHANVSRVCIARAIQPHPHDVAQEFLSRESHVTWHTGVRHSGLAMSLVGETVPPCIPLSYKWKLHQPNIFLQKSKNAEPVTSPKFKVYLPRSSSRHQQVSTWHLEITYMFYLHMYRIRLVQGNETRNPPQRNAGENSKVLVSDYKIAILDPDSDEVKASNTQPDNIIEIDESIETDLRYCEFKLSVNGMDVLVIEVHANLYCISDPHETVNKVVEVPMDDIRQELHSLYKNEVLADTVIKCEDQEFKAHKAILASQSPVFKKMFEVDMKEKETGIVRISEVAPAVVSEMVSYFYTGEAPCLNKHAKDLLNVANMYELKRLFTMCEKKLIEKIKLNNVLDFLGHAELHNASELKNACLRAIRDNSVQIFESSAWTEFKSNQVELALRVLEYTSSH